MLVLSRTADESFVFRDAKGKVIGKITVLEIKRHQVRIGLDMADDINIIRGEIFGTNADYQHQTGGTK